MRTETTTRTLYLLHELPEDVQQKACEKFNEHGLDHDWWEYTYSDFETICEIIGVDIGRRQNSKGSEPKIYFSGFWSQGDGASFFGRYRYAKDSKKKIREHAPQDTELHRIADALFDIQKAHSYTLAAEITSLGSNYSHSNTMSVESYHETKEITSETYKEVQRLLRSLADWLYEGLQAEHEYLTSFESFKEQCEANEYEFTEDGRLA